MGGIQGHALKHDTWPHKTAAETRPWPRFRGRIGVAHVTPVHADCGHFPMCVVDDRFWFSATYFGRSSFQSQ